ncbi:hypothetical protein PGT21_003938 [Puccinia graminis f. sp. tritici]|uniref:Uncharacterized protein n=1 Tax=Puccinia graminis f. sp. tritici TaxID=56615 RepID=A0A5B0NLI2_PUCGR|nr:hypothetical protein PGT21_003938 [Puccinia graminis f. sp. tritici]
MGGCWLILNVDFLFPVSRPTKTHSNNNQGISILISEYLLRLNPVLLLPFGPIGTNIALDSTSLRIWPTRQLNWFVMTSTLSNGCKTQFLLFTGLLIANFLLPDQSLLNDNQKIPSSNQTINPQVFNLIRMARIHNKRNHNKSRRLAKYGYKTKKRVEEHAAFQKKIIGLPETPD